MGKLAATQCPKSRILGGFWRIVNVFAFINEYAHSDYIHRLPRCMRRNDMVSFRRTKRRNYTHPGEKYMIFGVAAMFVVMLIIMLGASSGKNRLETQLNETREIMAASIQRDLTQALRTYENIGRKNADLADDLLPAMRLHMYAANEMNEALSETFGEEYSMIAPEQYKTFETIMDEFDQLMAAGQSTDPAKEKLTACMSGLETALANRFTADGSLLPKTASTASQNP